MYVPIARCVPNAQVKPYRTDQRSLQIFAEGVGKLGEFMGTRSVFYILLVGD